jgi:hypothetical protein
MHGHIHGHMHGHMQVHDARSHARSHGRKKIQECYFYRQRALVVCDRRALWPPLFQLSPKGYFLGFSTLFPIMAKVEACHKFNHYMNRRKDQ